MVMERILTISSSVLLHGEYITNLCRSMETGIKTFEYPKTVLFFKILSQNIEFSLQNLQYKQMQWNADI